MSIYVEDERNGTYTRRRRVAIPISTWIPLVVLSIVIAYGFNSGIKSFEKPHILTTQNCNMISIYHQGTSVVDFKKSSVACPNGAKYTDISALPDDDLVKINQANIEHKPIVIQVQTSRRVPHQLNGDDVSFQLRK